jgi:hypothetical protein
MEHRPAPPAARAARDIPVHPAPAATLAAAPGAPAATSWSSSRRSSPGEIGCGAATLLPWSLRTVLAPARAGASSSAPTDTINRIDRVRAVARVIADLPEWGSGMSGAFRLGSTTTQSNQLPRPRFPHRRIARRDWRRGCGVVAWRGAVDTRCARCTGIRACASRRSRRVVAGLPALQIRAQKTSWPPTMARRLRQPERQQPATLSAHAASAGKLRHWSRGSARGDLSATARAGGHVDVRVDDAGGGSSWP